LGLIGQIGKKALLLGAGYKHHFLALCGTLEGTSLTATQGVVLGQSLT